MNRHRLILAADDYALAPGVSRGIAELIAMGRLSATGCMTASSFWPEHAQWLKPLEGKADIGIHLTLTDQIPLGPMPRLAPDGKFPPLGLLMRQAVARALPLDEIGAELRRQFDSFVAHMGRKPNFLDGHHHVHQLPGVRDIVALLYEERLAGSGAYVRSCHDSIPAILKRGVAPIRALVIGGFGRSSYRLAKKRGIPTNEAFRGVYDFSGRLPYGELFRRYLEHAKDRTLVMCHPGHADADLKRLDPVVDQREIEFAFFAGEEFPRLLDKAGLRLSRFHA